MSHLPLFFASFSIKLNEVGTPIKKPTSLILYDYFKIFLVSRKTSSDKRRGGSHPRKYVNTPSSARSSLQLVIQSYLFWIAKNNDDQQDLLPPSCHQGTISRRFHVLNVTFRPVSSQRQHTSRHTDSHEIIKPFSWKEAGLKMTCITITSRPKSVKRLLFSYFNPFYIF